MDTIDLKAIAVVMHREVSTFIVATLSKHPLLSDDERKDLAVSVIVTCLAEACVGLRVDPLQAIQNFWQQHDTIDQTMTLMDWAQKPHARPS